VCSKCCIWLHACPCEFFKPLFKVVVDVAVVVSAMVTFLLPLRTVSWTLTLSMMLNIPGVVTCITGSLKIDVHRKLYHLSFSQSDLKDVSLFITDCIRFNLPLCFCQHPFAAEFVSDMVLKANQETPIAKKRGG